MTNATARMRREVERLKQELAEAKAERETYYRTANEMAEHVAKMHSKMIAAEKAEQATAEERDRLAQDLKSLRAELHGAGRPAKSRKRAGAAGRA